VEALSRQLTDALGAGGSDAAALKEAGAAEPERAALDLRAAADDPDLATCVDAWAPALLRSAQPGPGARALLELVRARRAGGRPLDLRAAPLVPLLLGTSAFMARRLVRRPADADALVGECPDAPAEADVASDWAAIRSAKYDGLLRVTARDLAARPFEQGLSELSGLADRCLAAGLRCASEEMGTPAPALFALGKLGGFELNFSSDVDVLFLYEEAEDAIERHEKVVRLVHRFKRELESPSEDGFAYRVDLDLRPEGRAGVLANTVDAALTYYESFGAEWERQMLIRLRPIAGDPKALERFCTGVQPFVYRRLIDPAVLRSVRDMKGRIESERRAAGRDLEADLKEGPGGIRDVEFLVQSMQLFHGGRIREIRTGNVLDALRGLGDRELLPEDVVASLRDGYLWLRRAEHSLQLAEEKQTARFPREPAAQLALARRMGYAEPTGTHARDALLDDWYTTRRRVREHFEQLVLAEPT
jgi:glutamate-ammonia-ligase adenylyltransferase